MPAFLSTRFAILAAVLALALPTPALASNKVSSPDVKKGQVELEYRGGWDFDDGAARDRQQNHKFVANYGLTDRWRMEAKGVYSGRSGAIDWTYAEWSNRYQLLKDGEGWLRLSVQANYKRALKPALVDKIEFGALAAKDAGKTAHVLNLNFENELGAGAQKGTDVNLGWKSKYKLTPRFEPGIEVYADFGRIGTKPSSIKDKYQAGPVVSGKITDSVKYEAGLLFGLSPTVPDNRLKLILTRIF